MGGEPPHPPQTKEKKEPLDLDPEVPRLDRGAVEYVGGKHRPGALKTGHKKLFKK